jgi:chloramphenicol 3-O phosphotransferase
VQFGQIVILNGPPRAGKSSIVEAIQETFDGIWLNLGVDHFKRATPKRFQPGIGLRPGGERPDLEPLIVTLYLGLYDTIAAHSRLGVNIVVDVGHHDAYSTPRSILPQCARRLAGLSALFVGVHCPVDIVMQRRSVTWGSAGDAERVALWERAVHTPGGYDIEVDTSMLSPAQSADLIRQRLADGPDPTAFDRLARL